MLRSTAAVSVLSRRQEERERGVVRAVVSPLLLSLPLIEACRNDGTGAAVAAKATRAAVTTGLRALGHEDLAEKIAATRSVAELRTLVKEALVRLDEEESR